MTNFWWGGHFMCIFGLGVFLGRFLVWESPWAYFRSESHFESILGFRVTLGSFWIFGSFWVHEMSWGLLEAI